MAEKLEIIITAKDETKNALSSVNASFGTLGKTLGKAALGGIAALGAGIAVLVPKATAAASDVSESMNKVAVVFGDSAQAVYDFAASAATGLGQSQAQALEAAGTFGNLLTSIGIIPEQAANMSTSFVTLASDLASFNNASPEETLLALRSALTGETEPMKRFGVALSAAAIEAYALENGLAKSKDAIDPAIKAQAAYALILEQTKNAQGDFANTSDGLANQQRILSAQWTDLTATLGAGFLPIAQELMGFVTGNILPGITEFAEKIGSLIEPLTTAGLFSMEFQYAVFQAFGPEVLSKVNTVIDAFKKIKETVMSFVNDTLRPFIDEHWEELKGALIAVGAVLAGGLIVSGIAAIGAAIAALLSPIGLLIAGAALLGAAWAGNWGGIQDKTRAVIDFLKPYIEKFIKSVRDWWAENGAQIIAKAQEIWRLVQTAFTNAIAIIVPAVQAFFLTIQEWWNAHGAQVIAVVGLLWDNIKTIFETVIGVIQGISAAFTAAMQGDWEQFKLQLWGIVETLWTGIQTTFKNWLEIIKTLLGAKIAEWKAKFTEIDWTAVGQNIIDGVKAGVRNAAVGLANAVVEAARQAIAAVKDFLGIDSPSKAFMEIGKWMAEGMAVGFSEGMRSQRWDTILEDAGVMDLFKAGSEFSNVAGTIANFFKNMWYEPIVAQSDAIIGKYENDLASIRDWINVLESGISKQIDPMADPRYREAKAQEAALVEKIAAEKQRQLETEKELLRVQQQQQQFAFLQAQLDLLKLAQENNIDISRAFDGMTLGLEAGLPQLLDAVQYVMQQLIDEANQVLEIASPSKVFKRMGGFVMQGLATGMHDSMSAPLDAFDAVSNQLVTQTINNFNLSVASRQSTQSIVGDYRYMRALADI